MKFSLSIAFVASLFSAAIAQDINSLYNGVPSCAKSCISSAFTKQSCSSGDWKCFCSLKDGVTGATVVGNVAGHQTNECQSYAKGGCSKQDQQSTSSNLIKICGLATGGSVTSVNSAALSSRIAEATSVAGSLASAAASLVATASGSAAGNATSALSGPVSSATSSANGTAGAANSTAATGPTTPGATGSSGSGSAAGAAGAQSTSRAGAMVATPKSIGVMAVFAGTLWALVG